MVSLSRLLKRKQVRGSEACAVATARILLQVVAKAKWNDVDQLLEAVLEVGVRLARAAPRELVISNIVRRVLGLIRDEALENRNGPEYGTDSITDIQTAPASQAPAPAPAAAAAAAGNRPGLKPSNSSLLSKSLFHLLSAATPGESTATPSPTVSAGASTPPSANMASVHTLRSEVIDGIEEIMDEIGQVADQIASFAEVQIHPGDYILVHHPSPTVERFLVKAAAKRQFTVLIASSTPPKATVNAPAPYASLRKKLNAAKVKTINVMSSGIVAYMPKISKVVIGASAVLPNGAIISDAGSSLVARAAREFTKPVIVLSGVYKLCPEVAYDLEAAVELGDSASYVSFADGPIVNGVEVENAVTELVPPDLIDMYITNL